VKKFLIIMMVALIATANGACASAPVQETPADTANETEEAVGDTPYIEQEGVDVIYLAGGCFWGVEKLMQILPGIIEATSGYANGVGIDPTYEYVLSGTSDYRETVRVEYKPDEVSLDMILFTFFRSIDPTIENKQGNDVGSQYQSGIYYSDDNSQATVERIADIERGRYDPFAVEIKPLASFYDAEEYHQNYLAKNVNGYCHIPQEEFELVTNMVFDPVNYPRPSDDEIKEALTNVQYRVTQKASTEPAFANAYWNNYEKGIYVDIVTGEPLFSSSDKFKSGTGWPSFTKSIDDNAIIYISDNSNHTTFAEVRSRAGNSHLGHVFYGEDESPNGVRFCINSAALRFILFDNMEEQGYGYLKDYVI
jgi:peptide methionine sulfoxide reductase msrA/msrB